MLVTDTAFRAETARAPALARATRPLSHLAYRARALIALVGVVVLLEVGVLLGIELTLHRELRATLLADVDGAADALAARFTLAAERLATETRVVAEEPRLRAAVGTHDVDRATLEDVGADLRQVTRWDLLAILDETGKLSALLGAKAGPPFPEEDGFWRADGAVFRIARAPIAFGERRLGTLIGGERVTDARMLEMTRGTHTAALLYDGATLAAASLAVGSRERELAGAMAQTEAGEVQLGQESFVAREVLLDAATALRVTVLRSTDVAFAPYVRLRRTVFGLGIAGFAVALALAWLVSGGLSRPIARLAERATSSEERAERTLFDMRRLIEQIPDAIAVHDGDRFLYVNQALVSMLRHHSADRVIGGAISTVVHAEDRERLVALSRGELPSPSELRLVRADGVAIPAEVAAVPSEIGGTSTHLLVARDLTDRKALEERQLADQAHARELALARSIQMAMVPDEQVVDRGSIRLAGHFAPADQCGGDWWSYHDLGAGRLLVVIADVTGHGIPSAMVTTAAKAACEAVRALEGANLSCAHLLETMNLSIFDTCNQRLQMTCFAAIFDPARRILRFANAAHELPYLIRGASAANVERRRPTADETPPRREGQPAQAGMTQLVSPVGNRLGESHNSRYEEHAVALQVGDTLVWYTDGILDCENREGERFGPRRFRAAIRSAAHLDPAEMRNAVIDVKQSFCNGTPPCDDATMVVAKLY